ncbi:MAG: flagellar basal-body MS-ring/collar protein FliF [Bacillota bacterium]
MNFRDLLDKLKQRWQETNQTKKVLIILVSAVILAGLVYLATAFTRPNYALLLGDLEPKDAGDIVAQLEGEKVPYQLINGGTTILVPQEQVDELRVKLASDGLLTGVGHGFELFDTSKFGETDFQQQITFQRALQEELRRTITKVEGVEQARVHLVIPQKSVFIEEEGTASASVVIKLKPAAKLKPEQVKGLNDLIVGSVEGLKAENVHIIDTEGNVLNEFLKDPEGLAGGAFAGTAVERQQHIRRAYEKELENRVQTMLAKVLGPNKAVAMVTAELDFSQQQTNTTEVITGPIVSERSTQESGSGGTGGGVPGSTTQMPGQTIPGQLTGESSYEKSDDIRNYQHGSRVESVVQAPGRVLKLSTAVILDESASDLDRARVEQAVSAAIGYDQQRGDQIAVSTMPFDRSQYDLGEDVTKTEPNNEQLYMMIAAAAGVILILLGLIIFWIRRRRRKKAEAQAQAIEKPGLPLQEAIRSVEEEEAAWEIPPPKDKQKQLKDLAQERPDDVASVVKVWLRE